MRIQISHKFLVIVLSVMVLLLTGYIGASAYSGYIVSTSNDAYMAGYNDGVMASIGQLVVQTGKCNPVPVYFGNITRNLIDVACLQQQ